VPENEQVAIRTLEIEAEMNETQAKRLSELASHMHDSDHKKTLEALAEEATEKAGQLRQRARLLRARSA
jgi:rubrerythrin